MGSGTVVFCCQHIKGDHNRAQYQRAKFIASKYETVILSRADVCEEVEELATATKQAPDHALIRLLYPLWLFLQIVLHSRDRSVHHVHTTFSAQTLLAGALAQSVGHYWVADIWDDPRLGMDIEGRPTNPLRYVNRAYNRSLLFLVRCRLQDADLIVISLVPTLLEAYDVEPDAENVLAVTNGVDISHTRSAVADGESPQPSETDSVRLLYLGPVREARGLDVLLDALERVEGERPLTLCLVGNVREQDRTWFEQYRAEKSLDNVEVQLVGTVEHDRALHEVAVADVCLCLLSPSVQNYHFAYPIKVFEYMALGKAIICTRMGGTERVLTDEETALLVPPEDPGALARSLERLVSAPNLRQRLGATARENVDQYDWKRINGRIGERLQTLRATDR